jgi:hypothetical protein
MQQEPTLQLGEQAGQQNNFNINHKKGFQNWKPFLIISKLFVICH